MGKINKDNYELIQKYKFRSQKWTVFLMMFIFSSIIIGICGFIVYFNHDFNPEQIILTIVGGLFGLSGIFIGAKTVQNIKSNKNIEIEEVNGNEIIAENKKEDQSYFP